MDIERVNDNTLKFFITYRDIEDRGYSREEIWYNRAKGEELFWEVMTEVNTEDYFELEGPIWIHINASEIGLEVVVTRATFNPEQSDLSSMFQQVEEDEEESFDQKTMEQSLFEAFENEKIDSSTVYRYVFTDIDEIIPVAKRLVNYHLTTSLYQFENKYYLAVSFNDKDSKEIRNIHSIIREYVAPSKVTIHRLKEYGNEIMEGNCFETINEFF